MTSMFSKAPEWLSVLKILENRQRHYVPSYQRPYVWKEDRAVDLLSDLWEANGDRGAKLGYFLGSLVLVPTKGKEE